MAHQEKPPPPPPVVVEGDKEEYEVEEIIASRKRGRGVQYLIKWKGYGPEHNLWVSPTQAKNSGEFIEEFHAKHPDQPGAPPQQKVRFLTQKEWPRELFPHDFFGPLTTGVDYSIPEERTCAQEVAKCKRQEYKEALLAKAL